MAFKPFGDTEPESITYNGNEVKVVNYNGTYVWGKPYTSSLTKTTGSGASAGVAYILRKTSQYEHASTSLSTQIPIIGTKNIYYGDSIAVHFTCPEGSVISSATVTNNGQSVQVITSDSQNRNTAFFTVNGDVSCTLATAAPSWNTIWTGSTTVLSIRQASKTTSITGLTIPSNVSDYRITYSYIVGLSDTTTATTLASDLPISYDFSGTTHHITVNSFTGDTSTGTATIECSANAAGDGQITLTKIEAYY